MNQAQKDMLEQAKQQGYLVMRNGFSQPMLSEYFKWCRSQKAPAIYVWFHGLSASFETNMDQAFLGHAFSGTPLYTTPDFTPTPEFQARCEALQDLCLASVSRGNYGRARVDLAGEMMGRYIDREMAVEAAKELWDIWQEVKQHLVFMPDRSKV